MGVLLSDWGCFQVVWCSLRTGGFETRPYALVSVILSVAEESMSVRQNPCLHLALRTGGFETRPYALPSVILSVAEESTSVRQNPFSTRALRTGGFQTRPYAGTQNGLSVALVIPFGRV